MRGNQGVREIRERGNEERGNRKYSPLSLISLTP
jgi:hypothetical protein